MKKIYEIPQITVTVVNGTQMLCVSDFRVDGDDIKVGLTDGDGDFGDDDVINTKGQYVGDVWD